MDDVNKAASDKTGAGSKPEGDVRIIEETIIAPPPLNPPKPPDKPAEPPPPPRGSSPPAPIIPPPPPTPPLPPPTPPPLPPPPPAPLEGKLVPPPEATAAPGAPISLAPPLPQSSPPAAPQNIAPPTPAPLAKIPETHASQQFSKEQEVIAKILKDAKLSELRTLQESKKQPATFDTALSSHQNQLVQAVAPEVFASNTAPIVKQKPSNAQIGATSDVTMPDMQEVPAKKEGGAAAEPAKVDEVADTTPKTRGFADKIVAPLRTLKDDLQNVVRLKKISLVRAVALEEEKRHHPSEEEHSRDEIQTRKRHRTFGMLFTVAVFILLGAAAFFGVFLVMEERGGTSSEIPQSAILFAESGVPLPLEGNALELKRMLANARLSGSGTLGSVTRIIPTISETSPENTLLERPATLQEFLRALGTRVPDELTRALSQDFFFGLHTVDENAPLFVIPVVSYERAFAGMLLWEETLSADLAPVFTPVKDQTIGGAGLPEKRRFDDVVMRNYDVRVLKDDTGTIQLYYSFPSRSLLVIAESPYSFTEILSRLRAERKL